MIFLDLTFFNSNTLFVSQEAPVLLLLLNIIILLVHTMELQIPNPKSNASLTGMNEKSSAQQLSTF